MQQLRSIDAAGGIVMPRGIWAAGAPEPAPYRPIALRDPGFRGLGQSINQLTNVAATGAGTLIATLVATGAIAGPIGAAIGAGIGAIAAVITTFFQPNWQKIQASNDANEIEQILKQNLAAWLSLPASQKTQAVQAAALANYTAAWNKFVVAVQSDLSKAPNSISDRQQGSCAYKVDAPYGWINGQYVPAGANDPQHGSVCWNWYLGYAAPIATDPAVIPDVLPTVSSGGGSVATGGGMISTPVGTIGTSTLLLLGIGAIALGVLL